MNGPQLTNIVFAGTPLFAADHLRVLLAHNVPIKAVYTQPDRPVGRGKKCAPSPVKALAQAHDLPVYQPETLNDFHTQRTLDTLKPDVMIVVAYGLLLPKTVLAIPRYGCINVHASSLPAWRGAAPIERAIEAGDTHAGVCTMQMNEGLDTGDILLQTRWALPKSITGDQLRQQAQEYGSALLLATLRSLEAGTLNPQVQPDVGASYAKKLNKQEAMIDWRLSAVTIERKIRAFNSSMPCVGVYQQQRVKLWQAVVVNLTTSTHQPGTIVDVSKAGITVCCGEQFLQLQTVQLPNTKAMPVADLLNGRPDLFVTGHAFECPR